MDGGRWEGEEKERITRRERDCHVFASFSLFDETGRPKCLLSPLNAFSAAFSCTGGSHPAVLTLQQTPMKSIAHIHHFISTT